MSVACGIYLRERGAIGNNKRLDVTGSNSAQLRQWEFTLLRRQGCGALTFTVYAPESAWPALEPYCVVDGLAHVYLNMNEAAEHCTWRGTLEDVPDPTATPPARTLRTFRARPTWAQLESPGATALQVYSNQTVNYMVKNLAVQFGVPQATISSDTTQIIAGDSYTVVQAILEDLYVGPTIKKLADINQSTVYGVSGQIDAVYFKDEISEATLAAHTFRIGNRAHGVKSFSRKQRRGSRANAFIVEGRDARSGNPMIVVAYDSALDSHPDAIWRWKRLRAPELVNGPDLKRWAEWLVAKEKDPLEEATLEIVGIDGYLTSGAIRDCNINIGVEDENGSAIQYKSSYSQWPLQSIAYRLTPQGSYDATLKLGNSLPVDALDELSVRDLLRELAVFEAKEFSNQVEVQADDDPWPISTYLAFLANNQMRNNVRIRLDNRIKAIDLDAVDPSTGVKLSFTLTTDYEGGLTGGSGDALGQFVTTAIGVGDSYDTWAILRRLEYPVLIEGQEGSGKDTHFYQPWVQTSANEGTLTPNWIAGVRNISDGLNLTLQPIIVPVRWVYEGTQRMHNGFLLHNTPLTFQSDLIFEFCWGIPYSSTDDYRFLVFNYEDVNNYHFIEMMRGASETALNWRVGKYIAGALTYSPLGAETVTVGTVGRGNIIRVTIQPDTNIHSHYVTVANIHHGYENTSSQTQSYGWWDPSEGMVYAGFRWLMTWTAGQGQPGMGFWYIKKLTFDNAVAGNTWYVSRDTLATWEEIYSVDYGYTNLLGAYAGGGTEDEKKEVYVKGFVAYPQILTGIALGWKDA